MKPIAPAEISALLDGELAPGRAEEVRRAIAEDQGLREVYQQLADVDRDLNSYAAACRFSPRVSLSLCPPALSKPIGTIALGLLIVRVLARTLTFGPAIAFELVALACVVTWFLFWLLPRLPDDQWQIARQLEFDSMRSST